MNLVSSKEYEFGTQTSYYNTIINDGTNLFVSGNIYNSTEKYNQMIVKLDSDLAVVDTIYFGTNEYDYCYSLIEMGSNLVVNGSIQVDNQSKCSFTEIDKSSFGVGTNKVYYVDDYKRSNIRLYRHEATIVSSAYAAAAYDPYNNRIWFSPFNQSSQPNWHYIDCVTGNVVAYAHGMGNLVSGAYHGIAYDSYNKRMWLAPRNQAAETNWHYIDCVTGNVVSYAHGISTTRYTEAYRGALYSETSNKVFFVPYGQAQGNNWHYIDCDTCEVVEYINSAYATSAYAYNDGVYDPHNDYFWFAPASQATQAFSHAIDCVTGGLTTFSNGSGMVSYGYYGGSYSPNQNRIYFAPYYQIGII